MKIFFLSGINFDDGLGYTDLKDTVLVAISAKKTFDVVCSCGSFGLEQLDRALCTKVSISHFEGPKEFHRVYCIVKVDLRYTHEKNFESAFST